MIFFFNSNGDLLKSVPDFVYQGTSEANKVYIIAPLSEKIMADVVFQLPNGDITAPFLLTNKAFLPTDGENFPENVSVWGTDLNALTTQYYGNLIMQVRFYESITSGRKKTPVLTTQSVNITINKGVVPLPPTTPTSDVWQQILSVISALYQNESFVMSITDNIEEVGYDNADGVTVQSSETWTYLDGSEHKITTEREIPIVAGAGMAMDKAEHSNLVEIINDGLEMVELSSLNIDDLSTQVLLEKIFHNPQRYVIVDELTGNLYYNHAKVNYDNPDDGAVFYRININLETKTLSENVWQILYNKTTNKYSTKHYGGSWDLEGIKTATNLNILNGEGDSSLVQKFSGEKDEERFQSTANVNYAVSLGRSNHNYGKYSLMTGNLNVNGSSPDTIGNQGFNSVVGGSSNVNTGVNSIVSGFVNTNASRSSLIVGEYNENAGRHSILAGFGNINKGDYSIIAGRNNSINKGYNIVNGYHNYTNAYQYITMNGRELYANASGQTIFGNFNIEAGALFEIGNGTSESNRHNAFEVYQDGRARAYGKPTSDYDLVRLRDLADYARNTGYEIVAVEALKKKKNFTNTIRIPDTDGTLMVRPEHTPTKNSLVQIAKNGQPSYISTSKFAQYDSDSMKDITVDGINIKGETFEKETTNLGFYNDSMEFLYRGNSDVYSYSYHLPAAHATATLGYLPTELPYSDSIPVYSSTGSVEWLETNHIALLNDYGQLDVFQVSADQINVQNLVIDVVPSTGTQYINVAISPDTNFSIDRYNPKTDSVMLFNTAGKPSWKPISELSGGQTKTLFGNQSIQGEGNIDLYEHDIVITGTNIAAYLTCYSSKNTKIDSLTDLKTLCGNTFIKSCTGAISGVAVMAITESKLLKVDGTEQLLTGVTFTDTVTTI